MRNIRFLPLVALLAALAPAARAETRIAIVEFQHAWEESEEGKAALAVLSKEKDEKQKQLDARQAEFTALRADYEKQQAVLSDQVKQQKEAELEKRASEMQQMFFQMQQELGKRQAEIMGGAKDRLSAVVKEIADREGIQVVIDKAAVVYAGESLDLTNEVIRRYNVRFPAKAGAAGAAKPAAATDPKVKPPAKPPAKPNGK